MTKITFFTIAIVFVPVLFTSCTQNLESAEFNAYFYYPDNREELIGTVTGLSSCQAAASSKADSLKIKDNWDYICCLKTSSSGCKSKHK